MHLWWQIWELHLHLSILLHLQGLTKSCVCVFLETSWVRSQHVLTPNLSHIEAWSRPLVVAFDAQSTPLAPLLDVQVLRCFQLFILI